MSGRLYCLASTESKSCWSSTTSASLPESCRAASSARIASRALWSAVMLASRLASCATTKALVARPSRAFAILVSTSSAVSHRGEQGGQRAGVRLAEEGGVQGCRGDGAQESGRDLRVHLRGSVDGRERPPGVSARELGGQRCGGDGPAWWISSNFATATYSKTTNSLSVAYNGNRLILIWSCSSSSLTGRLSEQALQHRPHARPELRLWRAAGLQIREDDGVQRGLPALPPAGQCWAIWGTTSCPR